MRIKQLAANWRDDPQLALATTRLSLYAALALHVLPALFYTRENYATDVYRMFAGDRWVFDSFAQWPGPIAATMAFVFLLGLILGIFGLWARLAAGLTWSGLYFFHHVNAAPILTLGLQASYGLLIVFLLSGAGNARWSIAPALRLRQAPSRHEDWALAAIVVYLLSSVFLSSLEKLRAGWLAEATLYHYLSSPKGVILRDWAASLPWIDQRSVGSALSYTVVALEFGLPLAAAFAKSRVFAGMALAALIAGFFLVLQVPLLFAAIYLPGLLLLTIRPKRAPSASGDI